MRRTLALAVMASVFGRASRGALGTSARDSEGKYRKEASTPNAGAGDDGDGTSTLGYVDENAGLRFGRIDEDVLRAILANDAEDDPDEMSGRTTTATTSTTPRNARTRTRTRMNRALRRL